MLCSITFLINNIKQVKAKKKQQNNKKIDNYSYNLKYN